jgi:hypothetical protein
MGVVSSTDSRSPVAPVLATEHQESRPVRSRARHQNIWLSTIGQPRIAKANGGPSADACKSSRFFPLRLILRVDIRGSFD